MKFSSRFWSLCFTFLSSVFLVSHALSCYKCTGVKLPEDSELNDYIETALTDEPVPQPVQKSCIDSLSPADHGDSTCQSLCIEAIASANTENYGGPDMLDFTVEETGKNFNFTQDYIKSLQNGKIVMRTCAESLPEGSFRDQIRRVIQEMKNENLLPANKFCVNVNGSALGISAKVRVCGCRTDYCNNDEPSTVARSQDVVGSMDDSQFTRTCPERTPLIGPRDNTSQCPVFHDTLWQCANDSVCITEEKARGCCHNGCYGVCRGMSYLRNYSFYNCSQLRFSNLQLENDWNTFRNDYSDDLEQAGLPSTTGTCIEIPKPRGGRCKTLALAVIGIVEMKDYSGPEFHAIINQHFPDLPFNFTPASDIGKMELTLRGCTDFVGDFLVNEFPKFPQTKACVYGYINGFYDVTMNAKICLCNSEYCNNDQIPNVNGQWSGWANQNPVQTCCDDHVNQQLQQYRTCDNPPPSRNGNKCLTSDGLRLDIEIAMRNCVCHGGWSTYAQKDPNADMATCCAANGQLPWIRHCNNPAPFNGGLQCLQDDGTRGLTQEKNNPCTCDGGWNEWTIKRNEDKSCCNEANPGEVMYTRTCNNPSPMNGGNLCLTSANSRADTEDLTRQCECDRDGGWSLWALKDGTQICCDDHTNQQILNKRLCNNPSPTGSGAKCTKLDGSVANDNQEEAWRDCSCSGGWSAYEQKDPNGDCCSVANRQLPNIRRCNEPAPFNGGQQCLKEDNTRGLSEEKLQPCSCQGGWAAWRRANLQEICCEIPSRKYLWSRNCTNPTPSEPGDRKCLKSDGDRGTYERESRDCTCDRNGGWSEWSRVDSRTCCQNQGTYKYQRLCNDPEKEGTGLDCQRTNGTTGYADEKATVCDCDGTWSDWAEDPPNQDCCDMNGQKRKIRYCNRPAPTGNGAECQLTNSQDTAMEEEGSLACACDGDWTGWEIASESDKDCCDRDNKIVTHKRTCAKPSPLNGGQECLVQNSDTERALEETSDRICDCHRNGSWSKWRPKTAGQTCCNDHSNGKLLHERTCDDPEPQGTGEKCKKLDGSVADDGKEEAELDCNCDGQWSNWTKADGRSDCCDKGDYYSRSCNNPQPINEGKQCLTQDPPERALDESEYRACPCHGSWSRWHDDPTKNDCCKNGGKIERFRVCNNPEPKNGGLECLTTDKQSHAIREILWVDCGSSCNYEARDQPGSQQRDQPVGQQKKQAPIIPNESKSPSSGTNTFTVIFSFICCLSLM